MTDGQVCRRCRGGEHLHDRYTESGADAGCPFVVEGTDQRCRCPAVIHLAYSQQRPHCDTCTCGRP